VLRSRALGEADRILTLFTAERGKIDAVAKGIRRAKSHFAGRMEFGNECALTMHAGRSLDVIVGADLLGSSWERIVEPERFAVASLAAEVIDTLCEPELALPGVYTLLSGTLRAIAASDAPRTVVPRFLLRLFVSLGIAFPLESCVQCGNALRGKAWADSTEAGLLCEACRSRRFGLVELDAEDLANLKALAAPRGDRRATVHARPRVAEAIDAVLVHHLGRKPKTVEGV
jgi:DNA repair protein RecO (recombination protein O)